MAKQQYEHMSSLNKDFYQNIPLEFLCLYAAVELNEKQITLSYSNIVVACFELFPEKFSLEDFKNMPDSSRVDKALWRNRKSGMLQGDNIQSYTVAERAKEKIEELKTKIFIEQGSVYVAPKKFKRSRRNEVFMKETMNCPAYIKYIQGKSSEITQAEVCNALQGTLSTRSSILVNALFSLKEMAKSTENEKMCEFLDWLKKTFDNFINF
jgi:hypothetical protein